MDRTSADTAAAFLAAARRHGFSVAVRDSLVTITRTFAVGDLSAFADCDCFGPMVLDMAPLRGGSVWGTDGASVGGAWAVKSGRYTLNKSGAGKRFISAVRAAVAGVETIYTVQS